MLRKLAYALIIITVTGTIAWSLVSYNNLLQTRSELSLLRIENGALMTNLEEAENRLAQTEEDLTSTEQELSSCKLSLDSLELELELYEDTWGSVVASDVQITSIFYDGAVYRTESDEYVEITNLGDTSQDLEGWVLKDISEGYPSFTFPSYVLAPGAKVRVYTNEIHSEWDGFSFGYDSAIWNNGVPDWAALLNDQGQEVSRRSY